MNYVYILRCADDTYYTGWTNDLTARLAAHNQAKNGAKYTRTRRPICLVYCEAQDSRSAAMKREAAIKKMSRAQKQRLIDSLAGEELLTIYDANEQACGVLPRSLVHQMGLRHHVCHLWLIQEQNGVMGHWLQQRGRNRPLYPGMYDLAATGHIDPDESELEGVIREAKEEIGLHFAKEQVLFIGTAEQRYSRPDGGMDDELVYAFAVRVDETPKFALGEEVERVVWVPLEEFQKTENGADFLVMREESIPAERICCLHKGEWMKFAQHLRKMDN